MRSVRWWGRPTNQKTARRARTLSRRGPRAPGSSRSLANPPDTSATHPNSPCQPLAALLLGGAAGSAVATDLGARTIREEVDALRVMGINPVQRLVTPRLAAIVFVAPVLCSFIIFMGLAAGYAINVGFQSGTPGSYI